MYLLMILWSLALVAAAEPPCDPLTQYAQGDQCCKKCGPGTSMSTLGNCEAPLCDNCRDDEYQDGYTTESKCKLQPVCDPNTNFESPTETSVTKRHTCMCKHGFKCSSKECITCVQHQKCGPGFSVHIEGNHTHDPVCGECPTGTFSNETSDATKCSKWTGCGDGTHIKTEGTSTSDRVCEEDSRSHLLLTLLLVFVPAVVMAGSGYWMCKRKSSGSKDIIKDPEASSLNGKAEQENTVKPLVEIATPEQESSPPDPHLLQAESNMTPEEDDEQSAQRTDNGKILAQEGGKEAILSRQESQPSALITFEL